MLLLAGPLVAIIGIVAIVFVMRHKSVEKRSMYSARRSQIEHKVRAARQRTLAPHGHAEKPAEPPPEPSGPSPFDQPKVQPTVAYQAPAYEPPPMAPPHAPAARPEPTSSPMPWEVPSTPAPTQAPAPASTGWDFPPATTAPPEPFSPAPAPPVEPFRPAPGPTPMPPSEPVWTPAPKPAEPLAPAPTVAPAAASTSAGGWSVVSTTKESAEAEPETKKGSKKRKKDEAPGSSWELASGDAPGMETEEPEPQRPSGTMVAVAQYAVLVVGLVMVLIGVLVMVANSHVT